MPSKKILTFIVESLIIINSEKERELEAKLNSGFRLLNTFQSEALARTELVRNSEARAEAKKLPRIIKDKNGELISNPERSKAFEAAQK